MYLVIDQLGQLGQPAFLMRPELEMVLDHLAVFRVLRACGCGDLPVTRLLCHVTDSAGDFQESAFGVILGVVPYKMR